MNFSFRICPAFPHGCLASLCSDFGFEHALGCRAVKFKSGGRTKMNAAFERWLERASKSEIRNPKSEIAR